MFCAASYLQNSVLWSFWSTCMVWVRIYNCWRWSQRMHVKKHDMSSLGQILYCLYIHTYIYFYIYLVSLWHFHIIEINSIYAVRSGDVVALKMTYSITWLGCLYVCICLWKDTWRQHYSQGPCHAPIRKQVGVTVGGVGYQVRLPWNSATRHPQVWLLLCWRSIWNVQDVPTGNACNLSRWYRE